MTSLMRAPIVVGVDGSPESHVAVDFAAVEAGYREAPLRLVHGYRPPQRDEPAVAVEHGEAYARSLVEGEAARVREAHPGVATSISVTRGDPARSLLAEGTPAALVVVGSRGLSSFHSLLLGSVAAGVVEHATVPVVVVRPTGPGAHGVVVGVDGSPGCAAAVAFAYAEAAARGTELTAVYPAGHRHDDGVLAEALAGWSEKYPDVELVRRAVHTRHPLRTLVEESGLAELVVIAAAGAVLVQHARVPVAVVPG
jgi:nucleotide-binding universal stress UspA family protein